MNLYFNNEILIIFSLLLVLTEQRILLENYKLLISMILGIISTTISFLFTSNIQYNNISIYALILGLILIKSLFIYYKLEDYRK